MLTSDKTLHSIESSGNKGQTPAFIQGTEIHREVAFVRKNCQDLAVARTGGRCHLCLEKMGMRRKT